jgi:hypothetical protein
MIDDHNTNVTQPQSGDSQSPTPNAPEPVGKAVLWVSLLILSGFTLCALWIACAVNMDFRKEVLGLFSKETQRQLLTLLPAPKLPEAPKPVSSLTYAEVMTNLRKKGNEFTDLQYDAYVDSIRDTRVRWTGWIDEVDENQDGCFACIDMDAPGVGFSNFDIFLDTVPEEVALSLTKDQRVTFTADITGVVQSIAQMAFDVGKLGVRMKYVGLELAN